MAFPASDGISFFAGAGNDGIVDDTSSLVEYNSKTDIWSIPYIWGKVPSPRKLHAAEPVSDGEVWFFGGESLGVQNATTSVTFVSCIRNVANGDWGRVFCFVLLSFGSIPFVIIDVFTYSSLCLFLSPR